MTWYYISLSSLSLSLLNSTKCFYTAVATFAVVLLARHRREIGSGERDLGAMVLPLSPGRRFIRRRDDRSRLSDWTAQIHPTSGHRHRWLCCPMGHGSASGRRRVCGPRLAARLAGHRIDSSGPKTGRPKFGLTWEDLAQKQIWSNGSDFFKIKVHQINS